MSSVRLVGFCALCGRQASLQQHSERVLSPVFGSYGGRMTIHPISSRSQSLSVHDLMCSESCATAPLAILCRKVIRWDLKNAKLQGKLRERVDRREDHVVAPGRGNKTRRARHLFGQTRARKPRASQFEQCSARTAATRGPPPSCAPTAALAVRDRRGAARPSSPPRAGRPPAAPSRRGCRTAY